MPKIEVSRDRSDVRLRPKRVSSSLSSSRDHEFWLKEKQAKERLKKALVKKAKDSLYEHLV